MQTEDSAGDGVVCWMGAGVLASSCTYGWMLECCGSWEMAAEQGEASTGLIRGCAAIPVP